MAEIHHFTYGWINPVVAFLMAFLGSLLGLTCAARARDAKARRRQTRWLLIAALSIGGAGIWLMHFMAMLGFDLPNGVVRYEPALAIGSVLLAIVPVAVGLFMVIRGAATARRIVTGGVFIGLGVFAMHYTGMRGLRMAGTMYFDLGLVAASLVVAVVAGTVALWFATVVQGWMPTLIASFVMGVGICGMHYLGMAALRVRLSPVPVEVTGISPFLLIVPITVVSAATLIAMAVSALQTMTEEEFDGAMSGRHRGTHNPPTDAPVGAPAGGPATHAVIPAQAPLAAPVVTPIMPVDQGMAHTV